MDRDHLSKMSAFVAALTHEAWRGLRNSQYIPPLLIDSQKYRFGRLRLLLWQDPEGLCDDEPRSMAVYQPFKDEVPLVRKSVWKRSIDMQLLRETVEKQPTSQVLGPRPTFEVFDHNLDRLHFEALLNDAAGLRIPIVWPWLPERDSLTEDVGKVGFEYFDLPQPQASVRCSWSMDLPPEWESVSPWFDRMFRWLDGHFHERSP